MTWSAGSLAGPPVRVLFVTESFHPVLGGGETHLRALARALVESGSSCQVVTRRGDPGWPERERLDGIAIRRVPPTGPARIGKYRMVGPAMQALREDLGSFDLLVVRGTRVLGLPALREAKRQGKPVVLQPEVNGELSGQAYWWGNPLSLRPLRDAVELFASWRCRRMRSADAFVAMSRQIRAEMLDAGLDPARVHRIPHGVDTRRFRPASAEEKRELRVRLSLPEDRPIVCFTGRLLKGKGLELLVDAFARVRGARPAHLAIVGSGQGQALSVEEAVRARVARLGLGSEVTFAGRVETVEDWLRAADVFAFPSIFEGLGISLIEAAACGLACIGARTGGIVDVIDHGHSGLLVEPGSLSGLESALAELLADAARRSDLGGCARQRAESEFGWERSVDRYRGLFTSVARAA